MAILKFIVVILSRSPKKGNGFRQDEDRAVRGNFGGNLLYAETLRLSQKVFFSHKDSEARRKIH
jgi:hypothetical protein